MNLDYFLDTISENQRNIISFLHEEFLNYPGVTFKMRFKVPFYDYGSWFCYLNPVKPNKVELCFLKGKEMTNGAGLLDDRGRKMVAGIMIADYSDMPLQPIIESFIEAMSLQEMKNKK